MFYDIFTKRCKEKGVSPTATLKKLNISTSKLTAWKHGSMPNSEFLIPISEYLEVSIDYLLTGKNYSGFSDLTDDEKQLLAYYSELSDIYKGMVIGEAKALFELEKTAQTEGNANNKSPKDRANNTVLIDLYTLPASAGTGVMLDDSDTEPIEVDADYLSDTKNYYAIRVSGDSMEPEYQDGDIVLVEAAPKIDEGEIGIFILNNEEGYIKKLGHGCLISLNPKYEPIELDDEDELLCRGRVLGVLDI